MIQRVAYNVLLTAGVLATTYYIAVVITQFGL